MDCFLTILDSSSNSRKTRFNLMVSPHASRAGRIYCTFSRSRSALWPLRLQTSGSSILMPQADDRNWPIPYLTWSGFDPFDMFSSARKTHRFEKHFCAGHGVMHVRSSQRILITVASRSRRRIFTREILYRLQHARYDLHALAMVPV